MTYHAFVFRCPCIEIDRGCSLEQRDHAIKESTIVLGTTGRPLYHTTGSRSSIQLCSEHPTGGEILLVCSTGVESVVLQYHQYFQSSIRRVYVLRHAAEHERIDTRQGSAGLPRLTPRKQQLLSYEALSVPRIGVLSRSLIGFPSLLLHTTHNDLFVLR